MAAPVQPLEEEKQGPPSFACFRDELRQSLQAQSFRQIDTSVQELPNEILETALKSVASNAGNRRRNRGMIMIRADAANDHAASEFLEQLGLSQTVLTPARLLVISDPGQDLDDEMAMIMLRYLEECKLARTMGVVCNLRPSFDRARLMRGTLDVLGMHHVPVGVGTDGGSTTHTDTFSSTSEAYLPGCYSQRCNTIQPGRALIRRVYKCATPKSITLLCISSLKDAAVFLRDNERLFVEKTKVVVIMGGVKDTRPNEAKEESDGGSNQQSPAAPASNSLDGGQTEYVNEWPSTTGQLEPDSAHNNMFDFPAAQYLYQRCQQLGIAITVVGRHAAYDCPVPRSTYDQLAETGNAIGWRLRGSQRHSIEMLWAKSCMAPEDPARDSLPSRCDKEWFLQTFCGGEGSARSGEESIWDLVKCFNMYDSLALLVCVPVIERKFFRPSWTLVDRERNVVHKVYGLSKQLTGLVEPVELARVMNVAYQKGLSLNHEAKSHCVLVTQVHNQTDAALAVVVLRGLYESGIVNCLDILISTQGGCDDMAANDHAFRMRALLEELGLGHTNVKVLGPASEDCAVQPAHDPLYEVYMAASQTGVVLTVSSSLTGVDSFIRHHTTLFREKTQSMVLLGGCVTRPGDLPSTSTGGPGDSSGDSVAEQDAFASRPEPFLRPDLTAQNNLMAADAAEFVYRRCQELGVKLVVVDRHLARECAIPSKIMDEMATVSSTGLRLRDELRSAMTHLWMRATANVGDSKRGDLPSRCDGKWFETMFCGGESPQITRGETGSEAREAVWRCVKNFFAYTPLAVLASVARTRDHFFSNREVRVVRGVSHVILRKAVDGTGAAASQLSMFGPSTGKAMISACQHFLCRMLFKGIRLNLSEFPRHDGNDSDNVMLWFRESSERRLAAVESLRQARGSQESDATPGELAGDEQPMATGGASEDALTEAEARHYVYNPEDVSESFGGSYDKLLEVETYVHFEQEYTSLMKPPPSFGDGPAREMRHAAGIGGE